MPREQGIGSSATLGLRGLGMTLSKRVCSKVRSQRPFRCRFRVLFDVLLERTGHFEQEHLCSFSVLFTVSFSLIGTLDQICRSEW